MVMVSTACLVSVVEAHTLMSLYPSFWLSSFSVTSTGLDVIHVDYAMWIILSNHMFHDCDETFGFYFHLLKALLCSVGCSMMG
jgi:hypothetical protein